MAWWDILWRDVGELFTTSKTRGQRRQCEFHLKVAEPMKEAAFGANDLAWREYFEELGRAVAANPSSVEARYLRSEAALFWFESMRPQKPDPTYRELSRTWDRDLKHILTHFPEKPPPEMTLRAAREMRASYDRICRGIRI